jgi:hypothetical protein
VTFKHIGTRRVPAVVWQPPLCQRPANWHLPSRNSGRSRSRRLKLSSWKLEAKAHYIFRVGVQAKVCCWVTVLPPLLPVCIGDVEREPCDQVASVAHMNLLQTGILIVYSSRILLTVSCIMQLATLRYNICHIWHTLT